MTDPIGWTALAAGAAALVGVLVGGLGTAGVVVAVVGALLLVAARRTWSTVLALVLVAAATAGWSQARADANVVAALDGDPGGRVSMEGRLLTDGRARPPPGTGWYARFGPDRRDGAPWDGPDLLLSVDEGEPLPLGTTVEVDGLLVGSPTEVAGRPVAGVVTARAVDGGPPRGLLGVAEAIRDRVRTIIDRATGPPAGPLLAGFLLGDVSGLDPVVREELRAAGLSHYVAVSGSNVALFLAGWWVLTMPLSVHPSLRWAVGWVGLLLFATVTRWEPSVVRASVMAALALASRRAGIVLSAKGLLGVAVAGVLLVVPRLASDFGFQLSAAATTGLVLGARHAGGPVVRALRATVAAQLAVAPLLLLVVGEVPLASPLANLVAAPLVSVATILAALGALTGLTPLVVVAGWAASAVVAIGSAAAPLPTIGWWGLGAVVAALLAWRHRQSRPVVVASATLGLLAAVVHPPFAGPAVAFLDVGQGDAAIVRGAGGSTILVDGGPDPVVLADALRRYGVDRVDLLVVSHRHADHVAGLDAVVGRIPVGELWHPDHRELGALGSVLEQADAAGVPRRTPLVGTRAVVGSVVVDVLGPLRRYASPNDESLVVRVEVGGVSVLFAGDIETFAQADLGPLPADVLKVPHQGAATSDPSWLAGSAGSTSVISVGPNDFGHPVDWVITTLEEAGALVCRTDLHGDVVVRPGEPVTC